MRWRWHDQFIDEAISFPDGTYKDQIDACSAAFNCLTLGNRIMTHLYRGLVDG